MAKLLKKHKTLLASTAASLISTGVYIQYRDDIGNDDYNGEGEFTSDYIRDINTVGVVVAVSIPGFSYTLSDTETMVVVDADGGPDSGQDFVSGSFVVLPTAEAAELCSLIATNTDESIEAIAALLADKIIFQFMNNFYSYEGMDGVDESSISIVKATVRKALILE